MFFITAAYSGYWFYSSDRRMREMRADADRYKAEVMMGGSGRLAQSDSEGFRKADERTVAGYRDALAGYGRRDRA